MAVRGGFGWLGQALAWLVILGVAAMLVVAVLVPRVAGAQPYTILSGSMEPGLSPGALVVVRSVDTDEINIGTVITYQLESGKAAAVTHRVVAQRVNGSGEVQFQTQGDANSSPDEAWVKPVQIRGAAWYAVPYLGFLNNLLTGQERQVAVYVVAALLLGYAVNMWIGAARDRARKRQEAS